MTHAQTKSNPDWHPISTAPENEEVRTRVYDDKGGERNVQTLVRRGHLWFFPDLSMYVYYNPTHWRPLEKTTA